MQMFSIHHSGSTAILLRFRQEISEEVNNQVIATKKQLLESIKNGEIYGIDEVVSAYTSLLIYFDPCCISAESLIDFLKNLKLDKVNQSTSLCLEVPLCYDESFGLDLEGVCAHCKCNKDELIALHTSPYYRVFMLGFMAGFPYLGGLDSRLFTPRLPTPRTSIEAGSVGIADKQTGIYPIKSPGGWNIIAQSPLEFFDKNNETNPTLLKAGMLLKFRAIDRNEFDDIKKQIAKKSYKKKIYEYQNN